MPPTPEHECLRLHDNSDTEHEKWQLYRDVKRWIECIGLEPDEYMIAVEVLAKELGV